MTPEKRAELDERNARIVRYYQDGHSISECGVEFRLGRQRVQQILKEAGAWKPYQKSDRTEFLGVSVSAETKTRLNAIADKRGVRSVSKLTSDLLDEYVQDEEVK
jgi:transposase